jgi:hypothetical protein
VRLTAVSKRPANTYVPKARTRGRRNFPLEDDHRNSRSLLSLSWGSPMLVEWRVGKRCYRGVGERWLSIPGAAASTFSGHEMQKGRQPGRRLAPLSIRQMRIARERLSRANAIPLTSRAVFEFLPSKNPAILLFATPRTCPKSHSAPPTSGAFCFWAGQKRNRDAGRRVDAPNFAERS